MLHRLVKILSSYVGSVSERKHMDLNRGDFTAEIIISTRLASGELIVVTNHINVVDFLPNTYSEIVRNGVGQTINFVAGASGNKRKAETDKLVKSFAEAKLALAESELSKSVLSAAEAFNASYVSSPLPTTYLTPPSTPLAEVMEQELVKEFATAAEPEIKIKKSRIKKVVDNATPSA